MKKILSISLGLMLLAGCSKDTEAEVERIENSTPEAFELLTPTEGAKTDIYGIAFDWQAARDPDGDNVTYTLYLTEEGGPTVRIATAISTTSYLLEEKFDYDKSYTWHVIATDGKREGEVRSATGSFSTRRVQLDKILDNNASSTFSPKRVSYTGTYFNDKLYIINGIGGQPLGNISSSADYGRQWAVESEIDGTDFERYGHSSVIFDNKMWVIGGYNTTALGTIYSSTDGANWIQEEYTGSFGQRHDHTSVVFNNKIWIIGGYDGREEFLGDVLSWTGRPQEAWEIVAGSAQTPFNNGIRGHSSVVFDDKMWVIGGENYHEGYLSRVWTSTDGINWTRVEDIPVALTNHKTAVYDNKIWVIGGTTDSGASSDIYYYDPDTGQWNYYEDMFAEDFSARYNHAVVTVEEGGPNDGIYIFGSFNDIYYSNDVWKLN